MTVLRSISGVLAGGLVVLAIGVIVVSRIESVGAGPGATSLVVHVVAAIGAVVLQVLADARRTSRAAAALASLMIVALVFAVLWSQWWTDSTPAGLFGN
ncbi:hypothetical protein [Millisia brevis]|uniref:hypothetical protein n=1 Tax=Millisia brevis TaxID=264148 RepID=UPI00083707A9|nr:hypothetical protein [Millisia brevis]